MAATLRHGPCAVPAQPRAALSAALGAHRVAWVLADCSCPSSWFGLAQQHHFFHLLCWAEPPSASPRACPPLSPPVIVSASFPSTCAKSKPRASLLSREQLQGESRLQQQRSPLQRCSSWTGRQSGDTAVTQLCRPWPCCGAICRRSD